MTDTDRAQVRAEIQRLNDEIAFLTRSRDEWRDLQQRAMACLRVCEERESWRERALQAEAKLAAGGAE